MPSRRTGALLTYVAFVVGIYAVITHNATPHPASSHHISNATFSGVRAVEETLSVVAAQPHMVNSDRNTFVEKFLADQLKDLQIYGAERGHVVDVDLDDQVNVIVNGDRWWSKGGLTYWQSTNLALRIRGTSNVTSDDVAPALLVSAHYDSVPLAPGATDNGISVAVMIEACRNILSRKERLQSSVVFLFNNGEEIDLLGGHAFTHHPWFPSVSAFINIDGGGAAGPGARSLLFRSNSEDMVRAYADSAPYPFGSVFAQNAGSLSSSDTDASVYGPLQGIPGLDMGYVRNRWLYHSQVDDIAHVSTDSVQHQGDNVVANVLHICKEDVSRLRVSEHTTGYETTDFVFADLRGTSMFVVSAMAYRALMIFLLLAIAGTTASITILKVRSSGWRETVLQGLLPLADAWLFIALSGLVPVLLVQLLSSLKVAANAASTYGRPEINLAWIFLVVLFSVMTLLHFVADKIRLAAIVSQLVAVAPTPGRLEESAGSASVTTELDTEEPTENTFLLPRDPKPCVVENEQLRPIYGNVWMAYAVLSLQCLGVLLAIYLSNKGLQGAFMLFETAFWASLAILINASPLGRRIAGWNWIVTLAVGFTIPFIRIADLMEAAFESFLPVTIAEGADETGVDRIAAFQFLLGFLILLPTMRLAGPRTRKTMLVVTGALGAILFVVACCVSPFSPERSVPVHYREVWDVTSAARAGKVDVTITSDKFPAETLGPFRSAIVRAVQPDIERLAPTYSVDCGARSSVWHGDWSCKYRSSSTEAVSPAVRDSQGVIVTWENALQIKGASTSIHKGTITRTFRATGPPGSRVCTFALPQPESGRTTLDVATDLTWVGHRPASDSKTDGPMQRTLYARRYSSKDRRIETDVVITYPEGSAPEEMIVECFLDETKVSRMREEVLGGRDRNAMAPTGILSWVKSTDTSSGGFVVRKVVRLHA
ncbi:hypothetical protein HKX48_005039 [Thoreauomyces humboldtii]|nr:hypothetical protein HKX48_005039 [Thoreauomyces humboldtii]